MHPTLFMFEWFLSSILCELIHNHVACLTSLGHWNRGTISFCHGEREDCCSNCGGIHTVAGSLGNNYLLLYYLIASTEKKLMNKWEKLSRISGFVLKRLLRWETERLQSRISLKIFSPDSCEDELVVQCWDFITACENLDSFFPRSALVMQLFILL